MTRSLALTGGDLIRALGNAASLPSVDRAVRARAVAVARRIAEGADDRIVTRVHRRDAGDYVVEVSKDERGGEA